MKESPAGHTRVERIDRAQSNAPAARQASVTQITPAPNQATVASDQFATPNQDHSASVAAIQPDEAPEQPAAIAPDPQAGTPKLAARKPEETPRQVQTATELPQPIIQAATEPPPKQVEQTERAAKTFESPEADRSAELSRRRPPHSGARRTKPRGLVVEKDPAQEVAMSRPPGQQRFDLFGGFFGRPADVND